jgi:hypothetical protein
MLNRDVKEYIESGVLGIRLLFYSSLVMGVFWSVLYYGFIVNAVSDVDFADLPHSLILIFGIGFLFLFLVVFFFLLPGIIVFYTAKDSEELREWLTKKGMLKIPKGLLFFAIPILMNILLLGIVSGLRSWSKIATSSISFTGIQITYEEIIVFLAFIVPLFVLLIWLRSNDISCKFRPFFAFIILLFFAAPFILILKITKLTNLLDFLTFIVAVFFAVVVNGLIAINGFNIFNINKKSENHFLRNIRDIAFLVILIVFFLSMISERLSLFITAPFKTLHIGQFNANLTIDNTYLENIQIGCCRRNGNKIENVKILDSIGKEYIIECKSGFQTNTIFRIPKNKVLLVDYSVKRSDAKK